MYGQNPTLAAGFVGLAGTALTSVWWLFAAITVIFVVVAAFQLLRPSRRGAPRP